MKYSFHMGRLSINTETRLVFSLTLRNMFRHGFTLQKTSIMVKFNIRETGNALLGLLEKELLSTSECRLTIDLLIPDLLRGDKEGLCASVVLICKCLNSKLLTSSVNIELSRASHSGESLNIKIDVRGGNKKRVMAQQFLIDYGKEIDALLAQLLYPTTFYANGTYVGFTFSMMFFDESNVKAPIAEGLQKKVLLVEDDDMMALVFTSFLEEWNYVVTRVSDGVSAVDAAKEQAHDIILMDTFLPKMSGADAIRKIRESDKSTPIIVLTSSPPDRTFSIHYSGANDSLMKPASSVDLEAMLRRYL